MNRKHLFAAPVLLLCLAFASPAAAKVVYSMHLGLNKQMMDDADHYEGGLNVEAQASINIPFPLFDLEAELKLGANTWTSKDKDADSAMIYRGSAGLRGGVNFFIYPYAYAHIGYGKISSYKYGGFAAPIAEGGIGLDVTALPYIRIGLFAAYNHVLVGEDVTLTGGDDDLQWFAYGLNMSYVSSGSD